MLLQPQGLDVMALFISFFSFYLRAPVPAMLYPLQSCSGSCCNHVEPQKTWNHPKSEQGNHFKTLRSAVSSCSSCITSRVSFSFASGWGRGSQMEEGPSGVKVARTVTWPVGWQGGFTVRCWCDAKCSQSGRVQKCVHLNISQRRRGLKYDCHRKEKQKKGGLGFSSVFPITLPAQWDSSKFLGWHILIALSFWVTEYLRWVLWHLHRVAIKQSHSHNYTCTAFTGK